MVSTLGSRVGWTPARKEQTNERTNERVLWMVKQTTSTTCFCFLITDYCHSLVSIRLTAWQQHTKTCLTFYPAVIQLRVKSDTRQLDQHATVLCLTCSDWATNLRLLFDNALVMTLTCLKSAEFFPPQSVPLRIAAARNVSERTVTDNMSTLKKK